MDAPYRLLPRLASGAYRVPLFEFCFPFFFFVKFPCSSSFPFDVLRTLSHTRLQRIPPLPSFVSDRATKLTSQLSTFFNYRYPIVKPQPPSRPSCNTGKPMWQCDQPIKGDVQRYAFALSAQAKRSTLGIASKSVQDLNSFPVCGLRNTFCCMRVMLFPLSQNILANVALRISAN